MAANSTEPSVKLKPARVPTQSLPVLKIVRIDPHSRRVVRLHHPPFPLWIRYAQRTTRMGLSPLRGWDDWLGSAPLSFMLGGHSQVDRHQGLKNGWLGPGRAPAKARRTLKQSGATMAEVFFEQFLSGRVAMHQG